MSYEGCYIPYIEQPQTTGVRLKVSHNQLFAMFVRVGLRLNVGLNVPYAPCVKATLLRYVCVQVCQLPTCVPRAQCYVYVACKCVNKEGYT